ncbi:glycosyltransferase [Pilimelia columellifera]|uniref:Glycosyltransferase n=1 Tax=Pilimelia columellifera subsp. columellifera TaxID=706583 RepID=A0ABN3NRK8_9ACTN
MRITYIVPYFRDATTGGGDRAQEFARRLVQRGHQVRLVADAAPAAARQPADLVVATGPLRAATVRGALAGYRSRTPLVVEAPDLGPERTGARDVSGPAGRAIARGLETLVYRRSAAVVALTPRVADRIRRRFPGLPVEMIPHGCDFDPFVGADRAGAALRARTPWLGDRPLLLYAGPLGPANGVEHLARASAALAELDPDVRTVVVGDGPRAGVVQSLAAGLGTLDRTFFVLNAAARPDVVAWFGACDLAMSTLADRPQLRGVAPALVFDALAASKPVAVNYGGWLTDLLVETGAGVWLPPDDPAQAAKMINHLLDDPRGRAEARAAAAGLAARRFNRGRLFERFHEVLMTAAGR